MGHIASEEEGGQWCYSDLLSLFNEKFWGNSRFQGGHRHRVAKSSRPKGVVGSESDEVGRVRLEFGDLLLSVRF